MNHGGAGGRVGGLSTASEIRATIQRMNDREIEYRARQRIDRVERKEPVEDDLVDLKATWPDPAKAARRLGGCANAARGEPFIWIIGVDEDDGVCRASKEELAEWRPKLEKEFHEGVAPDLLRHLTFQHEDKTVVVLVFESTRCPYVIKRGNDDRDVPWRVATRTVSATRANLLSVLVPIEALQAALNPTQRSDGVGWVA